jgi:hypothetical protein
LYLKADFTWPKTEIIGRNRDLKIVSFVGLKVEYSGDF